MTTPQGHHVAWSCVTEGAGSPIPGLPTSPGGDPPAEGAPDPGSPGLRRYYGDLRSAEWHGEAREFRLAWTTAAPPVALRQPYTCLYIVEHREGGVVTGTQTGTLTLNPGDLYSESLFLRADTMGNAGSVTETLRLAPIDIDAAKISHNTPSGELPEDEEETVGAFVPLNSDDDDYTATTSDLGEDYKQSGKIKGENDLLPLYLKVSGMAGAKLFLEIPSQIKVWKNADRSGDEVTSSTEIDPTVNPTLYAEGVAKGEGMLKLGLRLGGNDRPDLDRIKVTVFEMKGPLNVPGYSRHTYTADGTTPSGAKWLSPQSGTIRPSSGPPQLDKQVEILWAEGPVVGKARYEVNKDYVWDWEVNVVQVKLKEGSANTLTFGTNTAQNPQDKRIILSAVSPQAAMQAGFSVESVNGPTVGNGTRGEKFIELGFIQNAAPMSMHGLFKGLSPAMKRKSSLEPFGNARFYLDYRTTGAGTTPPWYDAFGATVPVGGKGHLKVPAGGLAAETRFKVLDSPSIMATDKFELTVGTSGDYVDEYHIDIVFEIFFAARTIQGTNDADKIYTKRAAAQWYFDGTGDVDSNGAYHWTQTGSGNGGDANFSEVTSGEPVPHTDEDPFNDYLDTDTWSDEMVNAQD